MAELLRRYLEAEFGRSTPRAPWYDRIVRVAVGLHTAVVHTDLSSVDRDKRTAEAICRAVSRFPSSDQGRQLSRLDVKVYGDGEQLLASYDEAQARPVARTSPRLAHRSTPRRAPPILPPTPGPRNASPDGQVGAD